MHNERERDGKRVEWYKTGKWDEIRGTFNEAVNAIFFQENWTVKPEYCTNSDSLSVKMRYSAGICLWASRLFPLYFNAAMEVWWKKYATYVQWNWIKIKANGGGLSAPNYVSHMLKCWNFGPMVDWINENVDNHREQSTITASAISASTRNHHTKTLFTIFIHLIKYWALGGLIKICFKSNSIAKTLQSSATI